MRKRIYLDDTLSYIRHCSQDPDWTRQLLDIADKAVDDTFIFTDRYEMERCTRPVHFDGAIDWNHIPFGDQEWCFAFSRHTFLVNLARAYSLTRDEKYRDAWIRLFEDFFHNTAIDETTRERSWRTLECGIRIENYIRSIEIFEDAKALPDDVMRDIDAFLATHVGYLLEAHTAFHRLSNWGVLQDHGLLLAASWLSMEDVQKEALGRLDEEIRLQTMDDGIHWEQSTTYHAEVLHAVLDSLLVATRLGLDIPSTLMERTHLLARGLAGIVRPDGICHLFGDSDEMDVRDILMKAAVLFDDGELSWIAQGGADNDFYASFPLDQRLPKPVAIADRSHFFQDTGNVILALSSDSEVRFHCGLYGSGHGHFDQLHFDIWHKGVEIITDSGRYTYVDGKERRHLKGSFAHNTIIVDGQEMARMTDSWGVEDFAEPLAMEAKVAGDVKYASSAHLGYMKRGTLPRRSILTLGSRYVIVFDNVVSSDECDIDTLFHIDEGTDVKRLGDDVFSLSKGNAKAYMVFATPCTATLGESVMSKRYNELLPCPLITTKTKCTGSLVNLTVICLTDDLPTIKREKVYKPLSGLQLDESVAAGLVIEDGDDRWTVCTAATEIPSGGFLTACGDAQCYARVFVKRNDEPVTVLKY